MCLEAGCSLSGPTHSRQWLPAIAAACISSCLLFAVLCAVHKQTRARPCFLQDDEAAFESYFAQEVPVVREKQELVQQIKQANFVIGILQASVRALIFIRRVVHINSSAS